jgi:hypothetical protein
MPEIDAPPGAVTVKVFWAKIDMPLPCSPMFPEAVIDIS